MPTWTLLRAAATTIRALARHWRVAVRIGPLLAAAVTAAALGAGTSEGASGYEPGDGTQGHVFAGYAEPPREVREPDGSVTRRPDRFCIHWDFSPGPNFPSTDHNILNAAAPRQGPLVEGHTYVLGCFEDGGVGPYHVDIITFRRADPTAGAITTIESVEAYARSLLQLPPPAVAMSPPPDGAIAGLETWIGPDETFGPVVRSAQAGPLWATASVTPETISYHPGDGSPPVTCPIGAPFRADLRVGPSCGRVVWTDTGGGVRDVELTATVSGQVWLRSSGDPGERAVDTLTSAPTRIPVTVRSLQPLID